MRDIKELIIGTLQSDGTMRTLTGAGNGDLRIYAYYQGTALIDPTHPAYVTVAQINKGVAGAATTPTFSLAIWGRDWVDVEAVRDRISDLLHKKKLATGTGRSLWTVIAGENDSAQQNSNFAGKTLHVRASWLEVP